MDAKQRLARLRRDWGTNEMGPKDEIRRRFALWEKLTSSDTSNAEPQLLRKLRIYGGAQGIWVDKENTANVSMDGAGVTVGIRHTGRHYDDELTEDALLYHYPKTSRAASRDGAEIQATKNAMILELPIFVILPGRSRSNRRSVRMGWVSDFDDESEQFLITFGETKPKAKSDSEDEPFELDQKLAPRYAKTKSRPGQARFRFEVLKHYGGKCAVCNIAHLSLIKAAHIKGKSVHGSDDWRNGLPLCSTHHDAFDSYLFGIDALTGQVIVGPGLDKASLGLTVDQLSPLRKYPHCDALTWRWAETQKVWKSSG
jgi:putative restriction endonuclease